jgi:hypothetical protein
MAANRFTTLTANPRQFHFGLVWLAPWFGGWLLARPEAFDRPGWPENEELDLICQVNRRPILQIDTGGC